MAGPHQAAEKSKACAPIMQERMKAPVAAAAIPDRKMIVAFTGASITLETRMLG